LTHKVPATKVTKALTEVFHIEPDPELFEYPKIPIPSHNDSAAEKYIKKLPPHKCVGIHYQGNTSAWNKNIDDDIMRHICNFITHHNYNVIILDWDGRSVLPNTRTIFCPGKKDPIWDGKGTGNAATIAALMNRFELFIGIDSGPLHIAGCTNTPTIGIWTHHHPIHFFDFADNVLHMLPKDAIKNIHARDIKSVNKFFQDNYQHKYYGNLKKDLMDAICEQLGLKETDKINQAVTSVVKNDVVKDNKGSKEKINQVAYSARKLKIVEKRNRKTESLHNEGNQTVTKIGKWWILEPKKPILS